MGIEVKKSSGWVQVSDGWMYFNGDTGLPVRNDWVQVDGKWYWFNAAGIMVTNVWYQYQGDWYYLGEDGAMVKGLKYIDGKFYYLDQNGRMATKEVTFTPDNNGALKYPEMAM